MNQRTTIKRDLRSIAEVGIIGVLGKVPRNLRRGAGRQFANEAYRKMNNLPVLNFKANPTIVDWIVREYERYQAGLSEASSEADRGDATDNGIAVESMAVESVDGEGDEETLGGGETSEVVRG